MFDIWHLVLLVSHFCLALTINVTIDDTYGDVVTGAFPTYAPESYWQASPADDMDFTRLRYETAHGLFGTGNITLAFNGTVIYVYFTVDPLAGADISFFLDGESQNAKRYERNATSGSPVYLYNQLVFASETLSNSQHELEVVVTSTSIGCLFFDYAVYSTQTSSANRARTERVNLGAIVAASVAGMLAIAVFCWYLLRRHIWREHPHRSATHHLSLRMMELARSPPEAITPFTAHPSSPDLATPAPKTALCQFESQKASRTDIVPLHQAAASSLGAEGIRGEPAQIESAQAIGTDAGPPPY